MPFDLGKLIQVPTLSEKTFCPWAVWQGFSRLSLCIIGTFLYTSTIAMDGSMRQSCMTSVCANSFHNGPWTASLVNAQLSTSALFRVSMAGSLTQQPEQCSWLVTLLARGLYKRFCNEKWLLEV